MRFTGSRMVFALTAALTIAGAAASRTSADAIYSVKEVGPVDATGNYLNDLSPADQAAFRTGSFDQYAHPAVGNPLTGSIGGEYDVPYTSGHLTGVIFAGRYLTSNNNGVDVGTGTFNYLGTATAPVVTSFVPSPHTAAESNGNYQPPTTFQSPGYVSMLDNGGLGATPTGINDHNVVIANVGGPRATIFLPPSDPASPLYLTDNHPQDLGALGGPTPTNQPFRTSSANALNDAGQIVGWSQTPGGVQHAFLDSASTFIMQDLNSLIPPTSGLTLTYAVGIDADGRIVAYGTDASGATREFLLTPQTTPQPAPEPTTLALFGLAAVAFGAGRLMVGRRKVAA